jgi:4-hydroxy-3-polyprenylbenzoate decarboxylase
MTQPHMVLAITGASGAIYAVRLLEVLLAAGQHVHLSISPAAQLVLKQELGLSVDLENFSLASLSVGDGDSPDSGALSPAMAELLGSSATASSGNVSYHHYQNLMAPIVHLKERRKLILVPRETPLSTIQLENMRRAAEAGAVVLPAMPGFYHGVRSIRDLVDFVVARICDQLGISNTLVHRWGS